VAFHYLVDQAEICTSFAYLIDFIEITPLLKKTRNAQIARLYRDSGLSSNQIAEKLSISKGSVIDGLHAEGIKPGVGNSRQSNPENCRLSTPPYGYRVRNGRLVIDKSELRVCRLAVHLIRDQKLSFNAAANELRARQIKNKMGTFYWDHKTVKRIFSRWNGKI
jgi:hypothetical protein